MPKRQQRWFFNKGLSKVIAAVDLTMLFLASQLALWTRFSDLSEFSSYGPYVVIAGLLLTVNAFRLCGLYRPQVLFGFRTILRMIAVWGMVFFVLIAIGYLTGTASEISRIWVALWFFYGSAGLFVWRVAALYNNGWSAATPGRLPAIVVIGDSTAIDQFLGQVGPAGRTDLPVSAVFACGEAADNVEADDAALGELIDYCRSHRVDEVVVACGDYHVDRIDRLLCRLGDLPVDIALYPKFASGALPLRGIREIGALQVISVAERPLSGKKAVVKRLQDLAVASLAIFFVAPLLPLIALAIKLDSRGPVFFRQTRYGFNNELIEVLKFRTMLVDQNPTAGDTLRQASRNDARVTRVGRWLRRTSCDELPQLLQVLSGTMSVVGPRPHAVEHHRQYAESIPSYHSRHRVKPGITGWAQVNGWRGETETIDKMKQRIDCDLYYISNWSLVFDFKIILMTVFGGMTGKSAY